MTFKIITPDDTHHFFDTNEKGWSMQLVNALTVMFDKDPLQVLSLIRTE